jgi:hypothetical protein
MRSLLKLGILVGRFLAGFVPLYVYEPVDLKGERSIIEETQL